MKSKRGDDQAVRQLQSLSATPYRQVLPGLAEADVSGWRNVRGTAEYDLTWNPAAPPPPGGGRRHKGAGRKPRSHQQGRREADVSDSHSSYMSGELDKSFNYVYRGGPSKRASSAAVETPPTQHQPLPPIPLHYMYGVPSTVHLDPALPYMPQHQTEEAIRANWARIVSSQLNSDLLVKQIVIENRLRTMHVDRDVGRLNLEGVGVDPKSIHELDKGAWLHAARGRGSSSSSSLLTGLQSSQQRKARKKRARLHQQMTLDWCTLNTQPRGPGGVNIGGLGGVNIGGLGGPNVMGEKALLQTFDEPTKYRLSRLTPNDEKTPNSPQLAKPPQFTNKRLQELLEREKAREGEGSGQPVHMSVVSPSLGMTNSTPELYWQLDSKVKHINKLRSLRW